MIIPHAPWWHTNSKSACHTDYNPTACLAGFALCYADDNSTLFKKCDKIAVEAIDKFIGEDLLSDMHTGLCYVRHMEYCEQAGILDLFSMVEFKQKLIEQVKVSITADNFGELQSL